MMSAKWDFSPSTSPVPMMNGKPLEGYDSSCYIEGWNKAQSEHDSRVKHTAEEGSK